MHLNVNRNVKSQLTLFLHALKKAGVTNILIIALDHALAAYLELEGIACCTPVERD